MILVVLWLLWSWTGKKFGGGGGEMGAQSINNSSYFVKRAPAQTVGTYTSSNTTKMATAQPRPQRFPPGESKGNAIFPKWNERARNVYHISAPPPTAHTANQQRVGRDQGQGRGLQLPQQQPGNPRRARGRVSVVPLISRCQEDPGRSASQAWSAPTEKRTGQAHALQSSQLPSPPNR